MYIYNLHNIELSQMSTGEHNIINFTMLKTFTYSVGQTHVRAVHFCFAIDNCKHKNSILTGKTTNLYVQSDCKLNKLIKEMSK